MADGDDDEGPAPGTLSDYSNERWIYCTAVVVMDTSGDWQAIITLALTRWFSVNVTEL